MTRPQRAIGLGAIALLVLLDEWMKAWALAHVPAEHEIQAPGFLTLAIHKNVGLAFDIPFKMPLIIVISIVIGLFLVRLAWMSRHTRPDASTYALMVILGALGNLYDRIVYGFTVDYLLVMGRLAVNACDVIILAGVVGLLFSGKIEPLASARLTNRQETGTL